MYRSHREVDYKNEESLQYHGRGLSDGSENEGGRKRSKGGLFGIFRNNPSLMIILLDIMVIVLVLSIILPFIGKKSADEDFTGLDLSLHGFIFEGTATVSLVVTSLPSSLPEGKEEETAEAELLLRYILLGEEGEHIAEREVRVHLSQEGGSMVVREEIEVPNGKLVEKVRAVVERSGERVVLEKWLAKNK